MNQNYLSYKNAAINIRITWFQLLHILVIKANTFNSQIYTVSIIMFLNKKKSENTIVKENKALEAKK